MSFIQNLIHKTEEGGGARYLRPVLVGLAVVFLIGFYNLRCARNMQAPEAMDAAQVARNVAEGKGYTTQFVRPFSMYLVQRRAIAKAGPPELGKRYDYTRIKDSPHPDLANPPVYPLVLAGLMKVLPFDHKVNTTGTFWSTPQSQGRRAWRHQPDFLITVFNQALFLGIVAGFFFWARRLFDSVVAWTSVVLLLGTETLWRFSASGLSTMLLLAIFTGLIWCLTLWETETREPRWGSNGLFLLAATAGLLTGVGGLTRYAFGWMILPVLLFFALFAGPRRVMVCLIALTMFLLVLTPWLVRNYSVSGTPFGTATYTAVEATAMFPEFRLERSLEPDLAHVDITPFWVKLLTNARLIVQNDLPRLGGGWVSAFFLVGLLLAFRSPALRRLRYFALFSLGMLVLAQALGRTQLSEETPEINSENLLVLLAPVALVYGVSLFYMLLDQIQFPAHELRYLARGLFVAVLCLPMVFALLPPKPSPLAYPPYDPQTIQQTASLLKENELMMSDVPWAVAWYGHRQCVWLTLQATPNRNDPGSKENFFTISDYHKEIKALYLTPETMDNRFLSQWVRAGEASWGSFILDTILQKQVPPTFPLHSMMPGFLPEQVFLCDWPRWRSPDSPNEPDKR